MQFGHLLQEISKEYFLFIRRGGVIGVEVTGPRQKSTQPDMGMEIPRILLHARIYISLTKLKSSWREKALSKLYVTPLTPIAPVCARVSFQLFIASAARF